ncbi:PLP-dependent transferase [Dentipellis sp. KUC8613]|nr:PLP-dependent transferase [Dentipellis sp. KUC8613]
MGNSHSRSQPTDSAPPLRSARSHSHLNLPLTVAHNEKHPARTLKHHKSTPFISLPCTSTYTADSDSLSFSVTESTRTSTSQDTFASEKHALSLVHRVRARSRSRTSSVRKPLPAHPPVPPPPHYAHTPTPPPHPAHTSTPPSFLPSPTAGLVHPPAARDPAQAAAYAAFLHDHPAYAHTWALDALRRAEFARVDAAGETYVDYMGGALYPESLVRVHMDFLRGAVLGNTHSASTSSQLSTRLTASARATVLRFFNCPPGSTVLFTANASAALKLFGESFPFAPGSAYLLPEDAHNSVHGVREFAAARGAQVCYVPAGPRGGVDVRRTKALLEQHRRTADAPPALFALTGLSNITNAKPPLALLAHARARGFATLLDAAALAPTQPVDLTKTPVDAVAISFYKMFGFPTGIGALILGPDCDRRVLLRRVWFAGGTVDVVQVPGRLVTRAASLEEQFEDGTINYLLLPAITTGLRFLSAYLPLLPARIAALTDYLAAELAALRHPNGVRACRVLSVVPRRSGAAEPEDEEEMGAGGVVACLFYDATNTQLPLTQLSTHAARTHIALRTGCMCNPGGAAALLALQPYMAALAPGDTLAALEARAGRELGVVRLSLGLGSEWADCWRVLRWVRGVVLREGGGGEGGEGEQEREGGSGEEEGVGRAM